MSFAYPSNPRQLALNKTTFFFPAGETTFVIGRSGSGKSTLANLLLRYYETLSGDIIIDGHVIQVLDTDWLRQQITLVQQDSVLFNETLWQNIEFGGHGRIKEKDIAKACQMAGLENTIDELPNGIDTVVGSSGRQLSGGQKQRVSIARARLRDAPILILDEGTSALDHTSRIKIMDNIREWRKGKTTIIITHDIAQIFDDDYVYVMESGVIVQEGYRKKLAEKDHGTFASFLPVEPSVSTVLGDIGYVSNRRNSEPASPLSPTSADSLFEDELEEGRGRMSNILGIIGSPPLNTGGTRFQNHRMSLGVASAYANDLRADNIWSSPNLSRDDGRLWSGTTQMPSTLSSPRPLSNYRPSPANTFSPTFIAPLPHDGNSDYNPQRGPARPLRPKPPPIKTILYEKVAPLPVTSPFEENDDGAAGGNIKGTFLKRKPATLQKIFVTVWPALKWKDRFILIIGFLAAFIIAAATPVFAVFFGELLGEFYAPSNREGQGRKWALALLGLAFVDGSACFITHYALEHSAQAWVNTLRVEALKRILAQPKSWFDKSRNSPGRLNECLDRNAEEMRNLIGRFAGTAFTAFWMLGISIVWAVIKSWKLTFVALACAPVLYGITRTFNTISSKWEAKCNTTAEHASSIFAETFSNIRVVRALTLATHFKDKHTKATADTYKMGLKRAMYSGLLFGLTESASYFVTALVFYYATIIISHGEINVGDSIQIVNLLLFGIANSTSMLSIIPQINSSRTTASHMLYLANLPLFVSHEAHGKQRLVSPFPIEFHSLNFTYPSRPHTQTLSSISLTLTPNSCMAIVGPSGSGKSTITSIILGLYPPDLPSSSFSTTSLSPLTFAGISILDCNISSLRSTMAIVSQTAVLFPTTIFSNIVYGLPPLSEYNNISSAIHACIQAGIHEFISSLPSGYHTLVGEGGQGLSGGQAQRIAIARALVRRPKLLILDEATSALDMESAEVIRETVGKLRRGEVGNGMAVVIISHSTEMMMIADEIVMLENGRIVETGGFEELRRRGGKFGKLIGGESKGRKISTVGSEIRRASLMTPVEGRSRNTWMSTTGTS